MALAIDDVVEVSMRGLLHGQRILTILHYVVSGAGSGSTETNLQNIATDFAAGAGAQDVVNTYMNAASHDLGLSQIRAQRVSPSRTVYKAVSVARSGADLADCPSPNIAASILKKTNTPGRRGIGRMQVAGLPGNQLVAGVIQDPLLLGPLTFLAVELTHSWATVTGTPITLVPCLFNPGRVPPFSIITDAIPENTVRTMHRRTLLVGE